MKERESSEKEENAHLVVSLPFFSLVVVLVVALVVVLVLV